MIAQARNNSWSELLTLGFAAKTRIIDSLSGLMVLVWIEQSCSEWLRLMCHRMQVEYAKE
jgi:hypothetical protein